MGTDKEASLPKNVLQAIYDAAHQPDEVVDFALARVGDHAYTWERADGNDFGEYRFETAGNPRDFYDDGESIVRKRWALIEVTVLPSTSGATDE